MASLPSACPASGRGALRTTATRCPTADREDNDSDQLGDVCDGDDDNDGIYDTVVSKKNT